MSITEFIFRGIKNTIFGYFRARVLGEEISGGIIDILCLITA